MKKTSSLPLALDRIGLAATLLLPLFLTHVRIMSEIMMDVLAVGLLARSACGLGWGWARLPWVRIALFWWGWQSFCTIPGVGIGGGNAFGQALLAVRFPLMAAALQNWTLRDARPRQWMAALLVGCCLYISLQILVQAVFGYNLFGIPRFPDGTLTGPYAHPRAAAPLSRLLLPSLMLGCAWAAKRAGRGSFFAMSGLAIGAVAIMVLAGQRIPMALTLLGIALCAFLYRPMRPAAWAAAAALPVLVLLARIFSPGSFRHLVLLAEHQLAHFGQSPYGAIFTRALVMARAHPMTGMGYDAFRHGCRDPRFFHGLSWFNSLPDGGGAAVCVQHAHNHYLQALTNSGLPGLVLFIAMVVAWLAALWPREGAHRAWRIGLFAAIFVHEWPIASSSDLLNLPLGGWAFLLLGVGLAEAASVRRTPPSLYADKPSSKND
ncbi:O-antigen ligase family protein [Kozakia baliensis]|uniref:O-antigen ligase family protein n=1 Tax=Kozakia baliensis TaxID=153496 RepID=UPI0009DEAB6E|nr:O-antigen ligase family protein [Kozakia baliensis]